MGASGVLERVLAAIENDLVGLLAPAKRRRLLALGEFIPLVASEVLAEPGKPTRHVWFPTHGCISLTAFNTASAGLEVSMVGREGMLGAHLALGIQTDAFHAVVRDAGEAWRVDVAAFNQELFGNPTLRGILSRYVAVLMAQLTISAACIHAHQIGPRLGRWLLSRQDRSHAGSLHATHDAIAIALGVRRSGVTQAAVELRRRGLIEYTRGEVKVLDRCGLEAAACGCYAGDRRVLAGMLG